MNMQRRRWMSLSAKAAAAGVLVPWQAVSFAQGEPTRVVVGFPPGGLPDSLARSLAAHLGGASIVDNRPGANGRLAAQAVKRAAPDGRTLLLAPASAMVHLPHIYSAKELGYDPFADFTPVAQLAENDFAFAVNAELVPARNIREFAAWCKAHPQQATFASPGQGSLPHFLGTMLSRSMGITMLHVPYKGNSLALNDVNGGTVTSIFATSAVLAPLAQAGKLRILGTTGPARDEGLPDVPTFAEQGVQSLQLVEGTWVLAPARTPEAVVAALAGKVLASLDSADMRNTLKGQAKAAPIGPVDLGRLMRSEFDTRRAAIKQSGFTVDQ